MSEEQVSEDDPRRVVLRVIVVTLVMLALATASTVILAYRSIDRGIEPGAQIDHRVKKPKIGGDPLNILVMGSDSRDGQGNDLDGQTGIGRRSDTTILVHVSADRSEVYGVSLPRDAMVTRPDCTGDDGETIPGGELEQFNAAFQVGGETCTVAQVESLTGVYVDHYVSVDFNGFKDMVDAVDGVTVCIPEAVDDPEHDIFFEAGTQELRGEQALNYVRERSQLSANADIGRMKRQQAFVASMINKVVSAHTLTRPNRVYSFVKAATASLVTDPDLSSLGELVRLAQQFRRTDLSDIEFITVPFETYEPDPNRLIWAAEAEVLWKRIIADKPLDTTLSGLVVSAASPPGVPTGSESGSGSPSSTSSPSGSGSPSDDGTPGGDVDASARENGLCA